MLSLPNQCRNTDKLSYNHQQATHFDNNNYIFYAFPSVQRLDYTAIREFKRALLELYVTVQLKGKGQSNFLN